MPFDRSWHNRAGVERVMGFATDERVEEFFHSVPEFERMLVRSGIVLLKLLVLDHRRGAVVVLSIFRQSRRLPRPHPILIISVRTRSIRISPLIERIGQIRAFSIRKQIQQLNGVRLTLT